jgi:hypothetical protein
MPQEPQWPGVPAPDCSGLHLTVSHGQSNTTVIRSIYNWVTIYENDNFLLGPPSSHDEGGMAVASNSHTSGNVQYIQRQQRTSWF